MTPEQIETLKKMADEQDKYSREWDWIADDAQTPAQAWEDRRKAAMYQAQATALRAAIALAKQARAMEGWEVTRYSLGEIEIYKSERGWTVLYKKKHVWLTGDGIWSTAIGKAKFYTRPHLAIAAANAAMKAE